MWKKWFPWRFIVRKVAQKQGFLDPIAFLAKLQGFGQPSEVALPIEIIRLGSALIARGSLNVVAIQHNLDWNWPYWVVRQFDPHDPSFIPRAFSLTHINLTHRNWTAAGIPGLADYPIVDPGGLLTPFYDGWSLDAWVVQGKGNENLIPAHLKSVLQKWELEGNPSIVTHASHAGLKILSRVTVEKNQDGPYCVMKVEASALETAWLVIALRPFNPEGVSEVGNVAMADHGLTWQVNKKERVFFSETPDRHYFSVFREGDVYRKILEVKENFEEAPEGFSVDCPSGMATAAALFRIPKNGERKIEVQIPWSALSAQKPAKHHFIRNSSGEAGQEWAIALEGHCKLQVHDKHTQALYDSALRTMLLHTPGVDVFPGPYTYKHFWFRDAAFILHALLAANLSSHVEKILDHFPSRQKLTGYFCSQEGEWDSNGQVLWIFRRFCELTGTQPKSAWKEAIHKGVQWIEKKRLSEDLAAPHAGLFPPGFSAEHLGPNDYYYWDDFWGAEGFLSAAFLMKQYNEDEAAKHCEEEAAHFLASIDRSLAQTEKRLNTRAMPASPYRRLDTGAIGSLTVGYPIDVWAPDDPRVMETVNYLLKNHFIKGGFFHDMSHSGINPYLTLTVAQILLRNDDPRYADLVRSLQSFASPTGQWPEAIHPQTLGGCMGDGQHVWAAAEWIFMIRNCFVREEAGKLILCSGVLPEWYAGDGEVSFGKTLTPYGAVQVSIQREGSSVRVSWNIDRQGNPPQVEIRLPGYRPVRDSGIESPVILSKKEGTL